MSKTKVGIIFGGRSGEHEVSLVSANSVINAIDKEKYEVIPIGITKEGQWVVGADTIQALKTGDVSNLHPATFHTNPKQTGVIAMGREHRTLQNTGQNVQLMLQDLDVVFPVMHGPYGEDGTIQGLFEMANIPYVGSGVFASAAAMDKLMAKTIWEKWELPQVNYLGVRKASWDKDPERILNLVGEDFSMPVFVKPANLGSSVGISKVKHPKELHEAIELAYQFDDKIIIEDGIEAREIEIAVLGNGDDLIVSPPGEVLVGGEFYDFYDKYVNGVSETQIPADIALDQAQKIKQVARLAYQALDCAGFARIDFFIERNSGKIYLSEINTIPGFTDISMYPKLMEAAGVPYPEVIDRLIQLAIKRHEDKEKLKMTFESESDWFQE
ncbi:D-alanine--D-alanine ligase [Candidatus Peregrinibacteria bacterium]|jgi:D-alanine-D-alanine ligase|nr:D-alanine--D-alanine ligase [Candidatus Peregrinibacteria bacterium]MBT7703557.1 D-alanine--D-alanine ligase [Candidatus Peregrinibacteria bacterium]